MVTLAKELEALGVDLVVLDQGIDSTTPSGRLLFHVLAAIAEFERELIRERVVAGLRRARARGHRLGRPRKQHVGLDTARAALEAGYSLHLAKPIDPTVLGHAIADLARSAGASEDG